MLRGDIYFANLGGSGVGSEQFGSRPVIIIQNNTGNLHSPTVIVAMISTCVHKAKLPTHLVINRGEAVLNETSVILCEQIRTIDKSRLSQKMGCLDPTKIPELDKAIKISLGLGL